MLKTSLFHFSEQIALLIVRDLTIHREVAIKCSLLSESLPSHMPLANKESVVGNVVLAVSFEVHGLSQFRSADHGLLFESSLIRTQSVVVNKISLE